MKNSLSLDEACATSMRGLVASLRCVLHLQKLPTRRTRRIGSSSPSAGMNQISSSDSPRQGSCRHSVTSLPTSSRSSKKASEGKKAVLQDEPKESEPLPAWHRSGDGRRSSLSVTSKSVRPSESFVVLSSGGRACVQSPQRSVSVFGISSSTTTWICGLPKRQGTRRQGLLSLSHSLSDHPHHMRSFAGLRYTGGSFMRSFLDVLDALLSSNSVFCRLGGGSCVFRACLRPASGRGADVVSTGRACAGGDG